VKSLEELPFHRNRKMLGGFRARRPHMPLRATGGEEKKGIYLLEGKASKGKN
jgi:hypothetical protein